MDFRRWRMALLVVGALAVVSGLAFLGWALNPLGPMPEVAGALGSDALVAVEQGEWIAFLPTGDKKPAGLIIYPGGRVDPRSYAPVARAIAEVSHVTVIVPMPLNLAVLGSDRASKVMEAHSEVVTWAVGGHSLGGAMAAEYAHRNPDKVDGLVLWAAYPPSGTDLSDSRLRVASIYATRDAVASPREIAASRSLLPADTTWVEIEGGNHSQFGWYGRQGGDTEATIPRQVQQDELVAATVDLLDSLP